MCGLRCFRRPVTFGWAGGLMGDWRRLSAFYIYEN